MPDLVIVKRGSYQDSARLMRIARDLASVPGITSSDVMMGTEANVALLERAGFPHAELAAATPMDMIVALRAKRQESFTGARDRLASLLAGTAAEGKGGSPEPPPRSVAEAVERHPEANLVSIAVPGPYAAFAAHRALDAGRHVFLFSDNVPLEDEIVLKKRGRELGLLVMGPDCGTAIIGGVGLGFADRVPRGPVGIVGASGTGIQELCCLLARAGVGISHAIGTGSRDLSSDVGGAMTHLALDVLAEDAGTRAVLLVAKHPAPEVAEALHGRLARLGKPVIVRYLGEPGRPASDGVAYPETLDEAAAVAAEKLGLGVRGSGFGKTKRKEAKVGDGTPARGRLVGLFGGGSLAAEARHVLHTLGVESKFPHEALAPGQPIGGTGHIIVDTGDDAYTVGRPHPMVDQTVRCGLIRTAGADRGVRVILLDLVLGDGAHTDPAPEIAAAVSDARKARGSAPLAVVCSVCGSPADPQDPARQEAVLREAGIHVEASAAAAARTAAALLGRVGKRARR